jgi:putative DNA methylase
VNSCYCSTFRLFWKWIIPWPQDVLQERLYCIRWLEEYIDGNGTLEIRRVYRAPDDQDLRREREVLDLLRDHFQIWQEKGYIPTNRIEPGDKTEELIRTRGWTYWHHLFNPRQSLVLGLYLETTTRIKSKFEKEVLVDSLLELGRLADTKGLGCKLLTWNVHPSKEGHANVFLNQALNPLFNYCHRTLAEIQTPREKVSKISRLVEIKPLDARAVSTECDLWITDPPYADAINYHELSEFFLALYEKRMKKIFTEWYTDSKRALAITGSDEVFRKSMVDCYRNLARHMPENGAQIVMFTHQDSSVWADLALILWASGLRVTAAWCIATETDSALKEGNYVQGTVLLVLRKQISEQTAFLDEIYPLVEIEVKSQLDSMLNLEDREDPNFGDTDYQLAAYAAALRVLTQYKKIEDIDVMYELTKPRRNGVDNPIKSIIDEAVKIACDYLIPVSFDAFIWKALTAEERFYLRGLDIESRGEYRSGAYQELARGFGMTGYKSMLASGRANQTRLKTATEFGSRQLGDSGFGNSLIRHALFAVREVVRTEQTETGRNWFRNELKESYWNHRKALIEILKYLGNLAFTNMTHWKDDAKAAQLLAVAVENDHV